jgi:hypothetical protein
MVAPKNTILFAGVTLNPVPLIVTEVPTGPDVGEKDEIVWENKLSEINILIKNVATLLRTCIELKIITIVFLLPDIKFLSRITPPFCISAQ